MSLSALNSCWYLADMRSMQLRQVVRWLVAAMACLSESFCAV